MPWISRLAIGLSLFAFLVFAPAPVSAATWQAGVAKVQITPERPLWMSGYASRNRPAEGTLTELWAKALLLQDPAGERMLWVTLDLIGLDRGLSQSICTRLAEQYQLPRQQVALCCSHTHTGPVVARNLRPMHFEQLDAEQRRWVTEYAQQLEDKIVQVAGQALQELAPCQLTWGSGTADFAVNRRNNPENEVPQLRQKGKLVGPVDHDVPVLAVRAPEGPLRAILFGYACHATVLSFYQWSGDYPGFAQLALEESHPEAVALFWAGCGGDQNPLPRRQVELARRYGQELAAAVERVLQSTMQPITGRLSCRYTEIDLPLDELPTRDELQRDAASENLYEAARARSLLQQLDSGQALDPTYPYPIATCQLGDQVQFVLLGGEVVVDYALRLKRELNGERTWVAAYSNDVMAYIPSRRVLQEGGYEGGGAMVYYGLPTVWAPQVEEQIIQQVHQQLKPAPQ